MDRTLFAAALAIAALANLAQSIAPATPTATVTTAAGITRTILPEDFLAGDLTAASDVVSEEFDRIAGEMVDILLRDGREMLAG